MTGILAMCGFERIKEHQKWFERKLKDRKSFLFVIEVNRLPVGQVRFEKINKRIMIDYSLDNIVRNRNWSKTMLILGIKKLIQSKSVIDWEKKNRTKH